MIRSTAEGSTFIAVAAKAAKSCLGTNILYKEGED
jgi:hypothetical protein